jgi:hypothetical protein
MLRPFQAKRGLRHTGKRGLAVWYCEAVTPVSGKAGRAYRANRSHGGAGPRGKGVHELHPPPSVPSPCARVGCDLDRWTRKRDRPPTFRVSVSLSRPLLIRDLPFHSDAGKRCKHMAGLVEVAQGAPNKASMGRKRAQKHREGRLQKTKARWRNRET